MKALKTLTALSFVLAAGTAFAQEATSDSWMTHAAAAKSRAQVQAELQQARASGEMKRFGAGYTESVKQSRPRAEVVAELEQARVSGEFDRLNAEAVSIAAQPAAKPAVFARAR